MNLSPNLLSALKGESPLPAWMYLLYPASVLYGMGAGLKARAYTSGLIKPKKLPCKVISVGNITAGGTGKTPMVIEIAKMLTVMGVKTAVLTRGYKGASEGRVRVVSDGRGSVLSASEAGDEPALIARSLLGVPVVMGSDRYEAGMLAWERFRPQAVILDDGFQHLRLHRDLNILLMDSAHPFGNGHVIPMGYLRGPKKEAKRADLVVFTGAGNVPQEALEEVKSYALSVSSMLNAKYLPISICNIKTREEKPLEAVAGKGIFAFCGIANPGSFSLILHGLNGRITGSAGFPDHYAYTTGDIKHLLEKAKESGAEMLMVTEKDAVKLEGLLRDNFEVYALKAGMKIDNAGPLEAALNRLFEGGDE